MYQVKSLRIPGIFDILFDAIAIVLVYMIPAISHLLMVPVYLFEPMRIIVIIALMNTSKKNVLILAVTLPLVSTLFSGHPVEVKSILMSVELLLNVILFYSFLKILRQPFISVFISILLSKLVYYLLKFILIKAVLLSSSLISTPIEIQLVITLSLTLYVLLHTSLREKLKLKRIFE